MVKIKCYKCKHEIEISDEDLIKCGRKQVIHEVNKILEKLRK